MNEQLTWGIDMTPVIPEKKTKRMNILVACEESQAVTIELRRLGHRAFSCDIQKCSGGHPEWHIQQNVLPLLDGHCQFQTADTHTHEHDAAWDMIVAFPPCTHLAVSGAAWFDKKYEDGRQLEGLWFFSQFLKINCEKVAVENPVNIISGNYVGKHFRYQAFKYGLPIRPTQIIHPWQFGDNHERSTCLWLKGLDPLVPEITEKPELEYFEWVDGKSGKAKREPKWIADARHLPKEERGKIRSKTFQGIARAMAEQWAGKVAEGEDKR